MAKVPARVREQSEMFPQELTISQWDSLATRPA
jgi:hypothetical protein